MASQNEAARATALRRKAERLGLRIAKSRARYWSVNDHQGWQILEGRAIVDGVVFDLTLDAVAAFLDRYEAEQRAAAARAAMRAATQSAAS